MDRGYSGSMSTSATLSGTPVGGSPRTMSEFEREANRLSMCVTHLHEVIQDLAKKLSPVLRGIPEVAKNAEKAPTPETQHAQYLQKKSDEVEMANTALHQLISALEI
jgi:hypothetical protein